MKKLNKRISRKNPSSKNPSNKNRSKMKPSTKKPRSNLSKQNRNQYQHTITLTSTKSSKRIKAPAGSISVATNSCPAKNTSLSTSSGRLPEANDEKPEGNKGSTNQLVINIGLINTYMPDMVVWMIRIRN